MSAPTMQRVEKGRKEPRVFTPPLRRLNRETSLGFEVIDFARDVLGIKLLPWQQWTLVHALELNEHDGSFRFRTVLLLVARQNGKTTLLIVLALWRMFLDNASLVIGTAQTLDMALETWEGAVDIAEGVPELNREIKSLVKRNGKHSMVLKDGQRYKVAPATRKGGRGLSGDLIMMDELREHTNWDSWSSVSKTTMARERPQLWGTSNAGDAASIVLKTLRDKAHRAILAGEMPTIDDDDSDGDAQSGGERVTMGLFEYSAAPDCSIWDEEGWAQANPALGYTISRDAIYSAADTDDEWVFRTEVLCQWPNSSRRSVFPTGAWAATLDDPTDDEPASRIVGPVSWGIDVNWERTMGYVAVAGLNQYGEIHIEVTHMQSGTFWIAPYLMGRTEHVAMQSRGAPVASLSDELEAAGVAVREWQGTELGEAAGQFFDHVRNKRITHLSQPVLDAAVEDAVTRAVGEAWVWDRKRSECSALIACNAAVWGMKYTKPKKKSIYETEGASVMSV